MQKGCGCFAYSIAAAVGLLIGLVVLVVAGYYWADEKVLSDEPAKLESEKWTSLDEAGLAMKLAPAARYLNTGRQGDHKMSLREKEVNRLVDRYILDMGEQQDVNVELGDTVMVIDFYRKVSDAKYLNGKMRAAITGKDGDFEVKAYYLKTGDFVWPKSLLPQAAKWVEGILETQTLFENDPWRLEDIEHDKKEVKVKVKIMGK